MDDGIFPEGTLDERLNDESITSDTVPNLISHSFKKRIRETISREKRDQSNNKTSELEEVVTL